MFPIRVFLPKGMKLCFYWNELAPFTKTEIIKSVVERKKNMLLTVLSYAMIIVFYVCNHRKRKMSPFTSLVVIRDDFPP